MYNVLVLAIKGTYLVNVNDMSAAIRYRAKTRPIIIKVIISKFP